MHQRPDQLRAEVRLRVAPDGDVVELLRRDAGVGEAPAGGERGEAGAVLDAVEPLLLDGGDELPVDDERGGGVAVVGVQAEDRGHGVPIVASFGLGPLGFGDARRDREARGAVACFRLSLATARIHSPLLWLLLTARLRPHVL